MERLMGKTKSQDFLPMCRFIISHNGLSLLCCNWIISQHKMFIMRLKRTTRPKLWWNVYPLKDNNVFEKKSRYHVHSIKVKSQNIFRECPIQTVHYRYAENNTVTCFKFKSELLGKKLSKSECSNLFLRCSLCHIF